MPPILTVGENAYVSVEDADAYFDEMYMTTDWFQLEEVDKIRLLITASKSIDTLPCKYKKASDEQKLNYPVSVPVEKIMGLEEARKATIAQAWYLFRNFENIQSVQDQAILGVKSENLGAIQTSKSTSGVNPFVKYAPEVYSIMVDFIDLQFRTGRA